MWRIQRRKPQTLMTRYDGDMLRRIYPLPWAFFTIWPEFKTRRSPKFNVLHRRDSGWSAELDLYLVWNGATTAVAGRSNLVCHEYLSIFCRWTKWRHQWRHHLIEYFLALDSADDFVTAEVNLNRTAKPKMENNTQYVRDTSHDLANSEFLMPSVASGTWWRHSYSSKRDPAMQKNSIEWEISVLVECEVEVEG